MINGTFDEFQVQGFGQSNINFDEDHEKTTVEAWYRPSSDVGGDFDSESQIYKNQGMLFANGQHAEFKVGSIISNANEIETERQYTFFLFRVTIGRAYVRQVNAYNRDQAARDPPPEDYNSVFLQDESPSAGQFQHTYAIHNCEKVRLLFMVKTKIKINPPNLNA